MALRRFCLYWSNHRQRCLCVPFYAKEGNGMGAGSKRCTWVFGVLCVLCAWPSSGRAEFLTSLPGLSGLGSYEGTWNYASSNSTHSTLDITLKNTSPPANGGYLTAFIFNNPGNKITGATLTSSNSHFGLIGGPSFNNSINGAPYGHFDIGASTGGSFEGGGNPSKGIAVGVTDSFHFAFTGTGLDTLNASAFFSSLSVGP